MEQTQFHSTVRRLRTYLGAFYVIMLYGVYATIMVEVNINRHVNYPMTNFFRDVWAHIGLVPKLYVVLVLYITLHLAVVGAWTLSKRLRNQASS
jgi:hypothetical protein